MGPVILVWVVVHMVLVLVLVMILVVVVQIVGRVVSGRGRVLKVKHYQTSDHN